MVEKVVTIVELMDFLQQKHHQVERPDSMETKELSRYLCIGIGVCLSDLMYSVDRASLSSEVQSTGMPQVNITIIVHGKLTGHSKRRYHDQVRMVGGCG